MSFRPDTFLSYRPSGAELADSQLSGLSSSETYAIFQQLLAEGIHGFCFSLYRDGQKPGDIIGEEQIRERMQVLKPHCRWVRSFSCIEGNELIPQVAKSMGLKTLVGAWLGTDAEKNRQEIESLIQLAQLGFVDVAAVGNEVLYRHDLSKAELLGFIREVKERVPGLPVGYVDAYYEFELNPDIVAASDVILANYYPFWEGTRFDHSLAHVKAMHRIASSAAQGKPVIVTETGWPSQGEAIGMAEPGMAAALSYFVNAQLWAKHNDVPLFYFSSFDESWKMSAEGSVGAYWGIWDKDEQLKFTLA